MTQHDPTKAAPRDKPEYMAEFGNWMMVKNVTKIKTPNQGGSKKKGILTLKSNRVRIMCIPDPRLMKEAKMEIPQIKVNKIIVYNLQILVDLDLKFLRIWIWATI